VNPIPTPGPNPNQAPQIERRALGSRRASGREREASDSIEFLSIAFSIELFSAKESLR
jgi:hypothetical protein